MGKGPYNGDLSLLEGHLHEPYQQDRVMAFARQWPGPFLLREAVAGTGLPRPVVHRCLTRLTKKGELRRERQMMSVPFHNLTNQGGTIHSTQPLYVYSLAERSA